MKTSEEMARSIMGRAKAKRAAQKRNIITFAVVCVCICSIGAGAWMLGRTPAQPVDTLQMQPTAAVQTPQEVPTVPTEPSAPNQVTNIKLQPIRISLLSSLSSGNHMVAGGNGLRVPAQQMIRVVDTRRLTEKEAKAVWEADLNYGEYVMEHSYGKGECRSLLGENAVVTVIAAGSLYIPIEDPDLVDSIQVSVTGDGELSRLDALRDQQTGEVVPGEYIIEGWDIKKEWSNSKGINMIWLPTEELQNNLAIDPTIPLSSITSTITTTVNMKDGTTLSVVVDVTVGDNGMVYFAFQNADDKVLIPCFQQVRVKDIRGLSDDDAQAVKDGEKEYNRCLMGDCQDGAMSMMYVADNAVASVVSVGGLKVPLEDPDLVDSVRVSVTGDGRLCGPASLKLTENGDWVIKGWDLKKEWMNDRGGRMMWLLTDEMLHKLATDPTIPLSSISSTITATINMKDGTKRSVIVDVSVDDDGMVYFTSRGETAE